MRKIAAVLAAGLTLAACGAAPESPAGGGPAPKGTGRQRRTIGIYSAVVRQLVTVDHTFGSGPPPFKHVYVLDHAVERAGDPMEDDDNSAAHFSDEVKEGLREELKHLPPIDFISDPDSVRLGKDGMRGVKDHGVVITLGPIAGRRGKAKVANSLWCGGLCGQWLTYVVELEDGSWEVTETTGPAAIS
jgi:hypothetical protein